jgi:hypothetical protein
MDITIARIVHVHRQLERALASGRAAALFDRMERMHLVMLVLSLVAVLGAVGGSHGLF